MHKTGTCLNLYVITREGEATVFRPSPLLAGVMVAVFASGGAFCLCPATIFLLKANDPVAFFFAGIFGLAAALMAVLAVWAWRTRHTPLSVEPGGRVCYGHRELCPAGSVRNVCIAPSPGGDAGDYEVYLEQATGNRVRLPSQYFPGLGGRDENRHFATALQYSRCEKLLSPDWPQRFVQPRIYPRHQSGGIRRMSAVGDVLFLRLRH